MGAHAGAVAGCRSGFATSEKPQIRNISLICVYSRCNLDPKQDATTHKQRTALAVRRWNQESTIT